MSARPFVPSAYQQRFFDWVRDGTGSCVLVAVAGSGKTTSVVRSLLYVPEGASVKLLAFNATIAQELTERVQQLRQETGRALAGVEASTFHSLGLSAVRKHLRARGVAVQKPDGGKVRNLLREFLTPDDLDRYGDFCAQLVGLAQGEGIGALLPDAVEGWQRLIRHHDLWLTAPGATEERAVEIARQALRRSELAAREGRIDFNDMLYLVVKWNLRLWQHDYVYVDEAQDTNILRRALARLALRRGGRLIAVGDPCQPSGTMVEVATRYGKFQYGDRRFVPIETLRVGDTVASWNGCSGHRDATSSKEGARYETVEGITGRPYSGQLVKVKVAGCASKYTLNHICFTRYRQKTWCVYLMNRGTAFRVGIARMFDQHGNGSGPLGRMNGENADSVWVLAEFSSRREALILETSISVQRGIPQTMFTAKGEYPSLRQPELDDIWQDVDNEERARAVLTAYGRLVEFPFYRAVDWVAKEGNKNPYIALRRPHEVRACNLLLGHEALVRLPDGRARWLPIEELKREHYDGSVYSLSVSRTKTYFADNILTHNCQGIYGFTGASHDAIDLIKQEFSAVELPLTVSYRCCRAVVESARAIVPYLEAHDAAPEGKVETLSRDAAIKVLTPRDAVVCRNTAPLVKLAYHLIGRGIGCQLLGRDVGAGLAKLVQKMRAKTIDSLVERLVAYRDREVRALAEREEELKAAAVVDRVECVFAVIESLDETRRTVPALFERLGSMFEDADRGVLTLCSIHKAKGKEWDRVALLEPGLLPSKWARQEWQLKQEANLRYVAYTRAKTHLIFV